MIIKDMFVKPIDRDIKGVIKVGQADDENIRQELEEYVVTGELQKHFADFFESYRKGINGTTDKMGVWISGFFGSGKSHFLKILSYLLENREVNTKKAIDYFIEDDKIENPMVLANMKLAASVSTDVILFNIDSKSEMTGKSSKDAIVSVFLKVFNEMQGYCGAIPYLADLERQLDEAGRYEEFKEKFADEFGKSWESSRNKFDFIQDTIVEVLDEMGFMSEQAGRNWCEKSTEAYPLSIEGFARLIKEYLTQQTDNHHIVFLVDEIGQYIGEDSKLMLNLQTVTEDLGTACNGKVWIVVTSQQDIDSVTKTKGNDFSKIQGRFDTRLSLSSANVDEVIKKRILDKNKVGQETLGLLYENKETIIKNLIVFNDGVEKKLYRDGQDFSAVYPFVPYQFNLLASVLTSIRTHGASGKHLSEGERSMIALFKDSAVTIMDKEQGTLMPFNVFYDALDRFLDHSHSGVIARAFSNEHINPDHEANCFNVNVLKTLFMVKYVKEITANLENITSLMIGDIDTDRIALKKRVEEALKILIRETLVQKNGELYVFLTDEEQEINREVDSQFVEMAEVIRKVSELVFEDILKVTKYQYPALNGRYNFAFNQIVDGRPYKLNQNQVIGVEVITPASDISDDETNLRMKSGREQKVLVVLPDDRAFIEEITNALKIEKFLQLGSGDRLTQFEQIKESKRTELSERKEHAKLYLIEAMKNAKIYVVGDRVQTNKKDVSSRIMEALGKLVDAVYHKLGYIDTAMGDVNIRELFKNLNQQAISLGKTEGVNTLARHDVLSFIGDNSANHIKSSMKTVMDRFMKAPYGFVEEDVEWLVAKLFKDGDISVTVSGEPVTLHNKLSEELVRYFTKKEFVEKLLTERREKANDKQKKALREVSREVFNISMMDDDDDTMMEDFKHSCRGLINDLEKLEINYRNNHLPGKEVVKDGLALLRSVERIQSPMDFFNKVDQDMDDFLDFSEDYEPVKSFFAGEQFSIFSKAHEKIKIYEDSQNFIANQTIESLVTEIKRILSKPSPYGDIPKLPELLSDYIHTYSHYLSDQLPAINSAIDAAKDRIIEELQKKTYYDDYHEKYAKKFVALKEKAETCNNVATLLNIKTEADALKMRLLDEMTQRDRQIAYEKPSPGSGKVNDPGTDPSGSTYVEPPVKKRKNISIKSISHQVSWQIESKQQLEVYLEDLKEQILAQLEEDTIVNIEF
ncbi:MAG: hypothetical protein PWP16_1066 [Eubacteriaceae bacterium]|nr:hypothetical protein [Eubacteriaceae bacterium]